MRWLLLISRALLYLVFTLIALTFASHAQAATYYVDATNGDDSLSGLSPVTSGSDGPWETISKVNSATFSPDDQVLFKAGETWSGILRPSSAGTVGHLITFSKYGSGANPVIGSYNPNGKTAITVTNISFTNPTQFQDDGQVTTAFNTYDAFLDFANPNTNNNGAANAVAGATNYPNVHMIVAFPNLIGTSANQIPSGSVVSSAALILTANSAARNNGHTIKIYRITRNWNPASNEGTVTYNKYDGTNNWTTAGGDIAATPISTYTFASDAPATISIDMTAAVQELINGTTNYGWLIKFDGTETNSPFFQARSREHGSLSSRPILAVNLAYNQPAAPTNLIPSDSATNALLSSSLSWDSVSNATAYDVYLGTTDNPGLVATTTNATFSPTLNPSTTYYWKVVAKNGVGENSSALQSFSTQAAKTYYVDQSDGSNANSGLSPDQAWKTIAKVNSSTFYPGDTILFQKGETWSERLELEWSGTEGNPITFGTYGTGSAPVFDGTSTGLWVGATDYYSGSALSWYVLDGLEIRDFQTGIDLERSSRFILRNLLVHDGGGGGSGLISISNSTDGEIHHNEMYGNSTQNGLWLSTGVSGMDVHHNQAYNCGTNGIGLSRATNNTIRQNLIWGNSQATPQYAGIGVEVEANNNQVYNNIVYGNIHAGLVLNGESNTVYHNTLYNNTDYQIILTDWGGSAPINNIFKNNIMVSPESDRAIAFFNSGTAGSWNDLSNIFDYNLYFIPSGDWTSYIIGLNRNYTFAQWQSIANQETHGLFSNPHIVAEDMHNYRLLADSPAINAGSSVSINSDYAGDARPSGSAPDIGAYEYQEVSSTPSPSSTPAPAESQNTSATNSPSLPPDCQEAVTNGIPDLFEIRMTQNNARLFVSPPTAPFKSLYVSYSRRKDKWEYGTEVSLPNISGVATIQINSLAPNTVYYFQVRAGSGCATGKWSNTMTARTTTQHNQKSYYRNSQASLSSKFSTEPKKVINLKTSHPETTDSLKPTSQSVETAINIAPTTEPSPSPLPIPIINTSPRYRLCLFGKCISLF